MDCGVGGWLGFLHCFGGGFIFYVFMGRFFWIFLGNIIYAGFILLEYVWIKYVMIDDIVVNL